MRSGGRSDAESPRGGGRRGRATRMTATTPSPAERTRAARARRPHAVRGVSDHRRRRADAGRPAHARRRGGDHLRRVPRPRAAPGRRPARARRAPRGHGRLHAHQPPRVPSARHRGDAPRRGAVLDLQHLVGRADRLSAAGCRLRGGDRRAGLRRADGRGRRARRARSRTRSCSTRTARGRSAWPSSRRRGARTRTSTSRRRWRAVGARRRAHADLHLGHDRAAQGRAAHPRQRAGAVPGPGRGQPVALAADR